MNVERAQYERARQAKQRLYGTFMPVVSREPAKPYTYRKTNPHDAWAIAMRGDVRGYRLEQLARELSSGRRIYVKDVVRVVCGFYEIPLVDLLSRRQNREVARPRQVAMYLSRELTQCSMPDIGRRLNRDHTTILHGHRAVRKRMAKDLRFANEIHALMEVLKGATDE